MTSETRRRGAFELLRFAALPGAADVVVLELQGGFAERGRFTRPPVLVVEREGAERRDVQAVQSGVGEDGVWSATYAVPVVAIEADSRFSLAVRGALLDLPAPDLEGGADRLVALAREANALRRALDAAEAEAAEHVQEARAEGQRRLEAARAAEAAARDAMADLRRERDEQAAAAAEALAVAEAAAEGLRRELAAEQERAAGAVAELQERLDAARVEQRALRRQLRSARAEVETLRRETARRSAGARRREAASHGAGDAEPAATADGDEEEDEAGPDDATLVAEVVPEQVPAPDGEEHRADVNGNGHHDDEGLTLPLESVRVIGRPPRHVDPVPSLPSPPSGSEPPARVHVTRGPGAWIAVGALVVAVVILLALLLGFG